MTVQDPGSLSDKMLKVYEMIRSASGETGPASEADLAAARAIGDGFESAVHAIAAAAESDAQAQP